MKTGRMFIVVGVLGLMGMAPATTNPENSHLALEAILKEVVQDGRVDYVLLKEKHMAALEAYIQSCRDYSVANPVGDLAVRLPIEDYINLYNANMLKAVVEHRAENPKWKPSDNNFGVFKEPRVKLRDGIKSLDYLETEIIRKMGDPRIHAALNCAAASCPPLIPQAYHKYDVDRLLEENMKKFVNDTSRNQFDEKTKTMKLSSIFNWFSADFGGADKVPGYIAKYRPGNYAGWKVVFNDYDWNLNEKK